MATGKAGKGEQTLSRASVGSAGVRPPGEGPGVPGALRLRQDHNLQDDHRARAARCQPRLDRGPASEPGPLGKRHLHGV